MLRRLLRFEVPIFSGSVDDVTLRDSDPPAHGAFPAASALLTITAVPGPDWDRRGRPVGDFGGGNRGARRRGRSAGVARAHAEHAHPPVAHRPAAGPAPRADRRA